MKYHQGVYRPQNPNKYRGDVSNVIYRSSWELKVMKYLDHHPQVEWWSSEETPIPYKSPLDKQIHRYFVDFRVRFKTGKEALIEVKPKVQTKPPKVPERKTKTYYRAVTTWLVNEAKWEAAKKVCEAKDWQFIILTEDHLGVGK